MLKGWFGWKQVLSSKNDASNRDVTYLGRTGLHADYDTLVTPGVTSGIAVPEDVTSLVNYLQYVDGLPVPYQVKGILSWERVRL